MQDVDENQTDHSHSSELDMPIWSVISFRGLEKTSLTFKAAADLIDHLETEGVAGLALVTDSAAARINRPRPKE
jgi:hypothetical protein